MKKSAFGDAVIGLVLTGLVAFAYLISLPLFESLELKAYDMRSQLRQNLDPSSEVVLVAIDDDSLAAVGRWPWPRTRLAALIEKLQTAGPRTIGLDIILSEPEQNQGLIELAALEARYKELLASRQLVDRGGVFGLEFSSAAVRLDSDSKLQASVAAAGNVVLPMFFSEGGRKGARPDELPAVVSSSTLDDLGGPVLEEVDGIKASYPIEPLAAAAPALGHVNVGYDLDGKVRREMPVFKYGGKYYPSYALQLVLHYGGYKSLEASFGPGRSITLPSGQIPLDDEGRMLITYNGPEGTFRSFAYQDVMNDKVDPAAFKGKIVIVGPTALGVATPYATPLSPGLPPIEMIANVIENILNKKFLTRPPYAEKLEWGLIAFMGLFIMLVLPRLKALSGAMVSLLLMALTMGAGTYLFVNGSWVKAAYPCILLALGYLVILTKRFIFTERGKELVEASAIETNKMLGLSFQGQGMLDMAFEKFRLCPLDDNLKDTLYNLALDFERKRQFAKAAAVLEHITSKDPKYRDCKDKIKMLKGASEGAVYGGVGGGKKDGTVMIAGGAAKPTLGRYEIEKELGRGAMGVVYLGKDPKINRQVAIKTMMLEEGSDAGSVKEIKERFFREAESAGTLNHPNIVRIFDAGEENDVAYIAMELLDGHDLTKYVSKDSLLPAGTAMEYVAKVADALDFAHEKGIVHRDIKPANVMLLKDGTIRVADFGIARITASSKTATGTVMGTPSYMSPEQVAGKKVDGRSDLFSLAVALFELLCGEKPFKGGEGIGTLLFQIANDPHPDPLAVKPGLPPGIKAVIDKGLAKNPDERYARGSLLAADLRAVIAGGGPAAPAPLAAPASTPAPAPAPEPEKTAEVAPLIEKPAAAPTPAPVPAPKPPEASVPFLSPEVAALVKPPAGVELGSRPMPKTETPAPPPPANPDATFRMTPAPPAAPAADPDATVKLSPVNPDATIKLTAPTEQNKPPELK